MTYHDNETDWIKLDSSFTKEVRAFSGAFSLLVVVVGVVGNFFVCLVVIKSQMMRNSTHILIANLAFVDLLQCLNFSTVFVTLVSGEWIFGHIGCQISGYLTICLVTISLYLLTFISMNRYTLISRPVKHQQYFTTKNTMKIVAVTWLLGIVTAAPPLFGYEWAAYVFRRKRSLCTMRFDKSMKYFISVSAIVLFLPLFVIVVTYWKIFKTVRKSRRQIQSRNESQVSGSNESKEEASGSQISLKMVRDGKLPRSDQLSDVFSRKSDKGTGSNEMIWITSMIFVIVAIFFIVYTPTMTINIIEMINPHYSINLWVDSFFINLAFGNHAINPIVYGAMNKRYRKAFKHYLTIC